MIDRIFWLHSKLSKDQCVRIVLTLENWEVTIDKTDVLKSDDGQLTILRANGNITVINPVYVIMICTMRKGVIL